MKNFIKLLALSLVVLTYGCGSEFDGVKQLAERRVPWLGDKLVFEKIESDSSEQFTLSAKGDKVVIGATNPNAAAVGLNWYLKYYCNRSMSHMGDNLGAATDAVEITEPVRRTTDATYRYALNYCTYNYTMSFYNWADWERELDWMALNGVNMMLIANGSEAVWQNTLRRIGYNEQEISDFITGPAYNAWWLMGNVEGWGGPMPQSQIDSRKELVQKMLARMKELGIEPLMPGFYGMVPSNFSDKFKANVIPQGKWGAFVRPAILDPTDPMFDSVATIFYDETRKLYGQELRFFSGDPFHEGGITSGVDLGDAGRAIQVSMQKSFPGSIWVLQGWQVNPQPELLAKLDKSAVLVQELFGENTNNWETRKGYEGTPFIWATVTNFGERPGLNGKLQRFADEVHRATNGQYAQYMKGVGVIPEGINNNPVSYELLLETVWHNEPIDVKAWINPYIKARYGKDDPNVQAAWQLLLETVYSSELGYQEGPPENVLYACPALSIKSVSSWGNATKRFDTDKFRQAARLFAQAQPQFEGNTTYRIDLINILRQVIANDADSALVELAAAYNSKDKAAFEQRAARFLSLMDTESNLLGQEPFYQLSTYQQQALNAGNTEQEKQNNLLNLMMLTTYWGENDTTQPYLQDYAYKEWAGMESYYKGRWELYLDNLRKELAGQKTEPIDFFAWERQWVNNNTKLIHYTPAMSLPEAVAAVGL